MTALRKTNPQPPTESTTGSPRKKGLEFLVALAFIIFVGYQAMQSMKQKKESESHHLIQIFPSYGVIENLIIKTPDGDRLQKDAGSLGVMGTYLVNGDILKLRELRGSGEYARYIFSTPFGEVGINPKYVKPAELKFNEQTIQRDQGSVQRPMADKEVAIHLSNIMREAPNAFQYEIEFTYPSHEGQTKELWKFNFRDDFIENHLIDFKGSQQSNHIKKVIRGLIINRSRNAANGDAKGFQLSESDDKWTVIDLNLSQKVRAALNSFNSIIKKVEFLPNEDAPTGAVIHTNFIADELGDARSAQFKENVQRTVRGKWINGHLIFRDAGNETF